MFRLKLALAVCLALSGAKQPCAQVTHPAGYIKYPFGAFDVIETGRQLVFFDHAKLVATAQIKPGGLLVPDVYAHEDSTLDVGSASFSLRSGKSIPARSRNTPCHGTVRPSSASDQSSQSMTSVRNHHALTLTLNTKPSSTLRDLKTCKRLAVSFIKPEDTASFFELRASSAGWWLLGSNDATLLTSNNGKSWRKARLPNNLQNVVSAYWPHPGALWLLGNEVVGDEIRLTFYRSSDQGRSWTAIHPEREPMPSTWFEAARQLAANH